MLPYVWHRWYDAYGDIHRKPQEVQRSMTDMERYPEIRTKGRILMGPGPSNVHPRVLHALSAPVMGHLDKEFLEIMNATKDLLAQTFMTSNELTIPISGTGSAGMETSLVNFIEPGDKVSGARSLSLTKLRRLWRSVLQIS